MSQAGHETHLEAVLLEARRRSLVGGLPVAQQIAHSEAFLRAVLLEPVDGPVLELGVGGGLPGLVMAVENQDLRLVLLDSARRSVLFLRWAVDELDLASRVEIVHARAEQLGREDFYRASFPVVVARSFCASRGNGRVCRTVAACRGPTDRLRTPRCDRELCLRPRHTVTSEMAARGMCRARAHPGAEPARGLRICSSPPDVRLPGPVPSPDGDPGQAPPLQLRTCRLSCSR